VLDNNGFSIAVAHSLGGCSWLLFLSNSGQKDGLTVAKFSDEGEFSSHSLHVFTQRREQKVGTFFQTGNPILCNA
jgi:hypothetical protein